jgi:hypothetical protein
MDLTSTFAPIAKTVEQDDGSLLVYGKATDGGLDLDDQRCDPGWLSTAMPQWFSSAGNIRAQHRADSAVGKAIEHTADSDGHYITARIVDREAIAKTKAGVFTGFSIGIRRPKIVKSPDAPNGLINGGTITEVSLCDRPANPACTLMLCKAATNGWEGRASDFDAELGLVKCEDLNFFPENQIVLKTVAEPVEPKVEEKPFVPAEDRAPVNPVFVEPVVKTVDESTVDAAISKIRAKHQALADRFSRMETAGLTGDADTKAAIADSEGLKVGTNWAADVIERLAKNIADPTGQWIPDANFDREAAVELVTKATDGLGQDETGDIAGANAAIATIAQLIISEAKDLAKMPAQGCDIHLLMSAVDALRCFARREQMEQNAVDPDSVIMLAAGSDPIWFPAGEDALPVSITMRGELVKSKYSADELKAMLADGKAMKNPNGDPSYPIADKSDLSNAIHAVGRGSGDHDAIRSYIKRRASALGASDMIPDSWKMAEPTTTKAENMENETVLDDSAGVAPVEDSTKSTEVDTQTPTEEPAVEKAAVDSDILVKALQDEESELHKMFVGIVEAKTEAQVKALNEELSATKALNATLSARLDTVEQMATPGGPNLRRTEVENKSARKSELERDLAYYTKLAVAADEDKDLVKAYSQRVRTLSAEIKAL